MPFSQILKIDKAWTQNDLPIFLGTMKDKTQILIIIHKSRAIITENEIMNLDYNDFEVITHKPPYHSIQNEKYHLLIINPCKRQHIDKYAEIKYRSETYEEHLAHIESGELLSCDWIKMILSGKADKILNQNDEFAITYNYKWDRKNISEMYLLLLFKNDKLYSLRELTLMECERAKNFILETVHKLYNIKSDKILLFFHYRPTFYHCHVHIVNIEQNVNPGMIAGRAVLLDDVIENLRIDANFYKKRKMFFLGV